MKNKLQIAINPPPLGWNGPSAPIPFVRPARPQATTTEKKKNSECDDSSIFFMPLPIIQR